MRPAETEAGRETTSRNGPRATAGDRVGPYLCLSIKARRPSRAWLSTIPSNMRSPALNCGRRPVRQVPVEIRYPVQAHGSLRRVCSILQPRGGVREGATSTLAARRGILRRVVGQPSCRSWRWNEHVWRWRPLLAEYSALTRISASVRTARADEGCAVGQPQIRHVAHT